MNDESGLRPDSCDVMRLPGESRFGRMQQPWM